MDETITNTAPIEISTYTPPVMRWVLGAFGVAIIVLPLNDLWRVLWPFNMLSLFFALLFAIPVAMGSLLLAGSIWGPDGRWVIADGHVSIIYERFGKTLTIDHPHTDFQSSTIETSDSDSGPDTYVIALRLRPEIEAAQTLPELSFLPAFLVAPTLKVRDIMTGHKPGLRSPHFKDRPDAESALSRLMRT